MTPITHQISDCRRIVIHLFDDESILLQVQSRLPTHPIGKWYEMSGIGFPDGFSLSDLISFLQRAEKLMVLQ